MILNVLFSSTLAVLAGVSIVIQQALNANLRGALSSAAWSGFASYAIGLGCMALFALALRDPIPSVAIAERIPWWAFSGGLFGAIFIGLAIFLVPQLGAATFIVLLVTGQMLASVAFDHFGAQLSIILPQNLNGSIRAARIQNCIFQIRIVLFEYAPDRFLKKLTLIVRRRNEGNSDIVHNSV